MKPVQTRLGSCHDQVMLVLCLVMLLLVLYLLVQEHGSALFLSGTCFVDYSRGSPLFRLGAIKKHLIIISNTVLWLHDLYLKAL